MIVFKIPNKDAMLGEYTVCPKEILQEAWMAKIGTTVECEDGPHKILSVKITETEVIVEMEGEFK